MSAPNKRGRAYRCQVCYKTGDKSNMTWHVQKCHAPLEKVPYYCTLCGYRALKWKVLESHVKKWTPHRVAAKSADEEELKKPFLKTSKQPYRITIADEPGEKADLTRLPAPESQKIFRMKKRTSTADNEEEMDVVKALKDQLNEKGRALLDQILVKDKASESGTTTDTETSESETLETSSQTTDMATESDFEKMVEKVEEELGIGPEEIIIYEEQDLGDKPVEEADKENQTLNNKATEKEDPREEVAQEKCLRETTGAGGRKHKRQEKQDEQSNNESKTQKTKQREEKCLQETTGVECQKTKRQDNQVEQSSHDETKRQKTKQKEEKCLPETAGDEGQKIHKTQDKKGERSPHDDLKRQKPKQREDKRLPETTGTESQIHKTQDKKGERSPHDDLKRQKPKQREDKLLPETTRTESQIHKTQDKKGEQSSHDESKRQKTKQREEKQQAELKEGKQPAQIRGGKQEMKQCQALKPDQKKDVGTQCKMTETCEDRGDRCQCTSKILTNIGRLIEEQINLIKRIFSQDNPRPDVWARSAQYHISREKEEFNRLWQKEKEGKENHPQFKTLEDRRREREYATKRQFSSTTPNSHFMDPKRQRRQ